MRSDTVRLPKLSRLGLRKVWGPILPSQPGSRACSVDWVKGSDELTLSHQWSWGISSASALRKGAEGGKETQEVKATEVFRREVQHPLGQWRHPHHSQEGLDICSAVMLPATELGDRPRPSIPSRQRCTVNAAGLEQLRTASLPGVACMKNPRSQWSQRVVVEANFSKVT